jgi:hypothetical protein
LALVSSLLGVFETMEQRLQHLRALLGDFVVTYRPIRPLATVIVASINGEISLPFAGLEKSLARLPAFPRALGYVGSDKSPTFTWVALSMLGVAMLLDACPMSTHVIAYAFGGVHSATQSVGGYGQSGDGLAFYAWVSDILAFLCDVCQCFGRLGDAASVFVANGRMFGLNVAADLGRDDGILAPFTHDDAIFGEMLEQILERIYHLVSTNNGVIGWHTRGRIAILSRLLRLHAPGQRQSTTLSEF